VCLLLVGLASEQSEQCERSEPASLRVAGGNEPERKREGGRRGLSAGPLGRFLLYVLRLRSFGFINVLLLYDMRRS
jgi:hypothetical protein